MTTAAKVSLRTTHIATRIPALPTLVLALLAPLAAEFPARPGLLFLEGFELLNQRLDFLLHRLGVEGSITGGLCFLCLLDLLFDFLDTLLGDGLVGMAEPLFEVLLSDRQLIVPEILVLRQRSNG